MNCQQVQHLSAAYLVPEIRDPGVDRAQWTDVVWGSAATVRDDAKPTAPQAVDAVVATAWARQIAVENALASMTPQVDCDLSDMIRNSREDEGEAK